MSETAADGQAVAFAGEEAWREAITALKGYAGAIEERAALGPEMRQASAAWLAALASWVLLGVAALFLYGRPAGLSVVCLFETVMASWGHPIVLCALCQGL
jgi:hypothetical protein